MKATWSISGFEAATGVVRSAVGAAGAAFSMTGGLRSLDPI
jgi:hypothetical protein